MNGVRNSRETLYHWLLLDGDADPSRKIPPAEFEPTGSTGELINFVPLVLIIGGRYGVPLKSLFRLLENSMKEEGRLW